MWLSWWSRFCISNSPHKLIFSLWTWSAHWLACRSWPRWDSSSRRDSYRANSESLSLFVNRWLEQYDEWLFCEAAPLRQTSKSSHTTTERKVNNTTQARQRDVQSWQSQLKGNRHFLTRKKETGSYGDLCPQSFGLAHWFQTTNCNHRHWDWEWRSASFRHFCHLSCLLWETCETVIVPFLATSMTLLAHSFAILSMSVCLKANKSVHTVISFMCFVTKKGVRWDYPCSHHLPDLLSVTIQEGKNHYSFVGSCLVSTVFSSRTVYTERTK